MLKGFVSHICAQHPRLVLWLHCLFENEERYHHFGDIITLLVLISWDLEAFKSRMNAFDVSSQMQGE